VSDTLYPGRITLSAALDVIKGSLQLKKPELEVLIHKHGGDYTQAQLSDLSALVVAGDNKSASREIAISGSIGILIGIS
jgi:DNA ligase-4